MLFFPTAWKNLNHVGNLCFGPQVYFQDGNGFTSDLFLELLKLEKHAVMLQGRHQHWKWDTGISLHPVCVCVCLVMDQLR